MFAGMNLEHAVLSSETLAPAAAAVKNDTGSEPSVPTYLSTWRHSLLDLLKKYEFAPLGTVARRIRYF
jgi:hypothetical protein